MGLCGIGVELPSEKVGVLFKGLVITEGENLRSGSMDTGCQCGGILHGYHKTSLLMHVGIR